MSVQVSKPRFEIAAAFVMAVLTFVIIMVTMPPPQTAQLGVHGRAREKV